jgi:hypothetical protein
MKQDNPSVLVFVWFTKTKATTMIKELCPGSMEFSCGCIAGICETDKHENPLQGAYKHLIIVYLYFQFRGWLQACDGLELLVKHSKSLLHIIKFVPSSSNRTIYLVTVLLISNKHITILTIVLCDPYIANKIAYILSFVLTAAKYELEEEAHLTGGTYIPLLTASDDRPEGGSVSADKYVPQSRIHYMLLSNTACSLVEV